MSDTTTTDARIAAEATTGATDREETTMRCTLLLHYPEMLGELDEASMAAGRAAFADYAATLHAAGVLVSGEVLQPSHATTTLREVDGALRVQDGPFADSKEQLGGTFVIEVADLDAAIEWAKRAPSVGWGAVEVRPSATHVVDGQWVGAL
ncbi:YciI family protein [Agrococcus terreus]|uniref:YciI family protein n=1 Tax=Agrococcus terreus TaxID=574649 RepID=UPI0038516D57